MEYRKLGIRYSREQTNSLIRASSALFDPLGVTPIVRLERKEIQACGNPIFPEISFTRKLHHLPQDRRMYDIFKMDHHAFRLDVQFKARFNKDDEIREMSFSNTNPFMFKGLL